MQIDPKMLNRLLSMNDAQLAELIRSVATEAGIDPAQIGLNPQSISDIRRALGTASEQDLKKINDIYQIYRQNRKKYFFR